MMAETRARRRIREAVESRGFTLEWLEDPALRRQATRLKSRFVANAPFGARMSVPSSPTQGKRHDNF